MRRSWVRTAVFLGIGYALVGIVFAVPATHVQAWRLGAWVVSAIGYAAHIALWSAKIPFNGVQRIATLLHSDRFIGLPRLHLLEYR